MSQANPGSPAVRDFGPGAPGFDSTYGKTWNGRTVTTGASGGVGYVQVDATEHGGGVIVLNGADLAPEAQTHMVVRLRALPGNRARKLGVTFTFPAGGAGRSLTLDLSRLKPNAWTTLAVRLPGEPNRYRAVQQVRLQGGDFGPRARALRVQIDRIGTARTDPSPPAGGR